jgi:hypothetical protein
MTDKESTLKKLLNVRGRVRNLGNREKGRWEDVKKGIKVKVK